MLRTKARGGIKNDTRNFKIKRGPYLKEKEGREMNEKSRGVRKEEAEKKIEPNGTWSRNARILIPSSRNHVFVINI